MALIAARSCYFVRSPSTISTARPMAHLEHSSRRPVQPACASRTSQQDALSSSQKRPLLLAVIGGVLSTVLSAPQPAHADIAQDIARRFLRPEMDIQQAVVILMDAKASLKQIQVLAISSEDSAERFNARVLWPGLAGRLRLVAEAAPVVASSVMGGDRESTLSELYGGTGDGSGAVTDAVYAGLGRVLTISGRTIRLEAQVSPEDAAAAEAAIEKLLQQVDPVISQKATAFRLARAGATAAS